MAQQGLSLRVGGFGGVQGTSGPSYGSASSYGSGMSATQAAFGPSVTSSSPNASAILAPNDGFGLAFWLGVGAIAALVFIRYSLPK